MKLKSLKPKPKAYSEKMEGLFSPEPERLEGLEARRPKSSKLTV